MAYCILKKKLGWPFSPVPGKKLLNVCNLLSNRRSVFVTLGRSWWCMVTQNWNYSFQKEQPCSQSIEWTTWYQPDLQGDEGDRIESNIGNDSLNLDYVDRKVWLSSPNWQYSKNCQMPVCPEGNAPWGERTMEVSCLEASKSDSSDLRFTFSQKAMSMSLLRTSAVLSISVSSLSNSLLISNMHMPKYQQLKAVLLTGVIFLQMHFSDCFVLSVN